MQDREDEWAALMRAANVGDPAAYRRLLQGLAPVLRSIVRRGFARVGMTSAGEVEDVVQEALLAIHIKRHTWDPSAPIGPWVAAIARNKLIDNLRRRKQGVEVPIEEVADSLPDGAKGEELSGREIDRLLAVLSEGQRAVVRAVSVEGASIQETARRLGMSDGAVRVALHRGLKALAARFGRVGE
ncbi:sigma-70 family RNA polymerase sigma factor [Chelatococcus sp. SYSU_G07232]|uniref:Sigma-70 family RNA polymerase sigma factor n=1 Tax=Chelatococcus albus TaxID=3047466 RepID=A0ABT7AEY2_9HYPH|nr:sigma-70 family RNA polymerase sigma factor [Chelatococcus sp. SYSU_G07232]MDJ1157933.1 sigma-70 family RNA polymerase sigma factor [Chelatococcus sp. SYSU_G07232]